MGLFFWDEILAYMVNLQLNQLLKPINKIISCVIFMLFFTNSQAQQVVDNLNQAERLIVQDIRAADQRLRDLELVIVNASNTDKLRWLTLSLNASATLEHTPRLQQLKNMYPKLLKTFGNEEELWRHLFSLTLEVFIENSTSALTQLQAVEAKVESFNAPFMSAFFYRSLYYSLINNNILDVALDIAIKNQRQWIALEEFYFALEMQLNMTRIRANAMADINTEQLILTLENSAKKLKATSYIIPITELKAQHLIQQGKAKQAHDLLYNVLKNGDANLIASERLTLLYYLANTSFVLQNYDETIHLAEAIITESVNKTSNNINVIKILLAKALIGAGDYEKSASVIADIQHSVKTGNDNYLQLQLSGIEIDILYRNKNIDGMYTRIKNIIETITTPQIDKHMGHRIARAEKAAYVEAQSKVVAELAENNLTQQEALQFNAQLISSKDDYLLILSVFCLILIILFFGLIYLIKRIKILANIDGLTAINNRRYGILLAEKKLKHYLRYPHKSELCFAMLDLDFFKKINDTYGHATGDKVIKLTVKIANSMLTKKDVICRMGGEEFLLVMPASSKIEISTRLEQILLLLSQNKPTDTVISEPITASVGITFVEGKRKGFADYIVEADEALYQAKQQGRNQICRYNKNSK